MSKKTHQQQLAARKAKRLAERESERRRQRRNLAITIASEPLTQDDDFPKGFYVRRIKGALWLRGYRAGAAHIWEADDHLLFCQT